MLKPGPYAHREHRRDRNFASPRKKSGPGLLKVKIRHTDAEGREFEVTVNATSITFEGIPVVAETSRNGAILYRVHRRNVVAVVQGTSLLVYPYRRGLDKPAAPSHASSPPGEA